MENQSLALSTEIKSMSAQELLGNTSAQIEEQTTAEKRLMKTPGAQGNSSTAQHVDNLAPSTQTTWARLTRWQSDPSLGRMPQDFFWREGGLAAC